MCGDGHTPQSVGSLDPVLRAQIAALLRDGRKLEAIALLRRHRPMPLRDAKDAVEQIERTSTLDSVRLALPAGQAEALIMEARDIARRGHKIEAIKLVRQRIGLGLREAKDLVDGLAAARVSRADRGRPG